ncbi:adenosylcobalamin/alpha-ribazole phosphatase [Serratia sp. L9]|uniref:adenosylcobalamin/alpha-ribazole phosphatase n=1 Tax=Serratia sp. L9 TaxID=3423946 RepID=UPI003D67B32D
MRIFLVRHGQTAANQQGVFCGSTDLPLTEQGVIQAQQVAQWLAEVPFTQATSSELLRARHSAEIVLGQRALRIHSEAGFNEMDFGDWEMCHHRDLQQQGSDAWAAWVTDWQNACPAAGESFPLFSQRIGRMVQQLLTDTAGGDRLLVAHQGSLSLLLAGVLAMPAAGMWHFHFEQGAYSVLDINEGFAVLKVFNSRALWQPATRE